MKKRGVRRRRRRQPGAQGTVGWPRAEPPPSGARHHPRLAELGRRTVRHRRSQIDVHVRKRSPPKSAARPRRSGRTASVGGGATRISRTECPRATSSAAISASRKMCSVMRPGRTEARVVGHFGGRIVLLQPATKGRSAPGDARRCQHRPGRPRYRGGLARPMTIRSTVNGRASRPW